MLTLAAVAAFAPLAHGAALIGGLGGPGPNGGYGPGPPLYANDDGSSASIDITPAFPMGLNFFGKTYKSMYVNTNGNITFNAALSTYTPKAFPVASQPMIAPFWGDVDTRGNGMPATNGIWWFLEPGRIVVTWSIVGYFNTHDDLKNDFQLILTASTCGTTDFDVEFRYNQIQWITGDASGGTNGFGGTPAQAGFDAGDSTNYVAIPNSLTAAIVTLPTTSNIGTPGVYRFQIRNGAVAGGCTGGGMSCDTGKMGACAAGINQCSGAGVACNPVVSPAPERCDGIDNDCNGTVDDGTGLCSDTQLCDRGTCVDICRPELGCPNATDVCTDRGTCVEAACATVTCPAGQRCKGGTCLQPCDGVICPHFEVCRVGRCVDPCAGVTCGMGRVCVAGACVPTCPCQACAAGLTCQKDGTCLATDCVGKACGPGQYCAGGMCFDSCNGAACPDGQICMTGQCVPAPPMDMTVVEDMTVLPDLATPSDLAVAAAPDAGAGAGTSPPKRPRGSTGCQMAPSTSGGAGGWPWVFAGLFVVLVLVPRAVRRRLARR